MKLNLLPKKEKPNVMLVVERTRKRVLRHIPIRYIPRDSCPRDYGNLRLHVLGLDLAGKLWSIFPYRKMIENETPTDLFMAKHCAAEVQQVYGIDTPWSEKIKLGIFAGLIIVILIFTFLISASTPEVISQY